MLLPYDTALSYWMMVVPLYEWQAEPPPADGSPSTGDSADGLPSAPNELPGPAVGTAAPGGAEGDEAHAAACQPQLKLVQIGVRWVAIPYWSPRENPFWNLMADGERDDDRQRLETKRNEDRQRALSAGRLGDHAAGRVPE